MFKVIIPIIFIPILILQELWASYAACICNPNICIYNVNEKPVFEPTIGCYKDGAVYMYGIIMNNYQYYIIRVMNLLFIITLCKILYHSIRVYHI